MFGSFVVPLIVFLFKRDSRFVSFHALQALIAQLIFIAVWFLMFAGFFAIMFASIPVQSVDKSAPQQPPAAFMFFPVIWLGMMGFWGITWLFALVFSYLAYDGRWSRYPLIGRLAERWAPHSSQTI